MMYMPNKNYLQVNDLKMEMQHLFELFIDFDSSQKAYYRLDQDMSLENI